MKKQTVTELMDALENLVVRFPLEGFAATPKTCKCLQFEDNQDCRHLFAVRTLKKAKTAMKSIVVLLMLAVLTACGGGSGGATSAAAPNLAQPDLTAPINGGGNGQPTSFALTYYKLSRTEAPVNGWAAKTYTATGNCVAYQSQAFCWDDGVKVLQWTDFSGTHYGPFTYTYFGYDVSGATWGPCHGACGTDLFAQPRLMSPTVTMNVGANVANNVFTNGTPLNVTCTETAGILSCGDFTIDLNQAAL